MGGSREGQGQRTTLRYIWWTSSTPDFIVRVGDILLGIEFGGGGDCGDTSQPLRGMRLARRGRVLPY